MPGAFSEPETKNIRDLVASRQTTMLISNHTFSNLVLRPNGVNPNTLGADGKPVGDSPDEAALKRLGGRMTAQNGYANIHGWQLYDTTGTTEDWSYNATGGFGYTFEIGRNEFHPPYPQVVDEYLGKGKYAGKGNREAYLIALEHAVDTHFHGILKGKAPKGATLRLEKNFQHPYLGVLLQGRREHRDHRRSRCHRVDRQPLHPAGGPFPSLRGPERQALPRRRSSRDGADRAERAMSTTSSC